MPPPEFDEPLRRELTLVLDRKGGVAEAGLLTCGEKEDDHVGVVAADPERGLDSVDVRHP